MSKVISDDDKQMVMELSVPADHPMSSPQAFGTACMAIINFTETAMKADGPAQLTLFMAVTIGMAQKLGISPRMLVATFAATVEGVATGNTDSLMSLMNTLMPTGPGEKGKVH